MFSSNNKDTVEEDITESVNNVESFDVQCLDSDSSVISEDNLEYKINAQALTGKLTGVQIVTQGQYHPRIRKITNNLLKCNQEEIPQLEIQEKDVISYAV